MLRPFSANAHFLSALDIESEEIIHTAFGPNLPRLSAVKKKYDTLLRRCIRQAFLAMRKDPGADMLWLAQLTEVLKRP
jgi:hypothetical protein